MWKMQSRSKQVYTELSLSEIVEYLCVLIHRKDPQETLPSKIKWFIIKHYM